MSETELVPYRIYVSKATIKKLEAAATGSEKDSGNKVAAAVVTDCLDIWIALQRSLKSHRKEFLRQVVAEIESGQPEQKS